MEQVAPSADAMLHVTSAFGLLSAVRLRHIKGTNMQIKVPPTSQTNLLDAREHRLTAFVTASVEAAAAGHGMTVLAVARCGESPVARALTALRPMLAAHGVKVRLVFAEEGTLVDQFMTDSADSEAGQTEVRIVRNPRLRDAHEQLIVTGASVWFGDSLRRDITRRDLFEQFTDGAPDAALAASRAFDRLWSRTEPYLTLAALATDSLAALPNGKPGNTGPVGPALC